MNISFSKVNKTTHLPKQKTVNVLFHIPREINVMENIYQNQLYIKRFFTKIMHVKARDVLRGEYPFSAGEYAYLFKIPFI